MSKEKLGHELFYSRAGYKLDRWKWVVALPQPSGPRLLTEHQQPTRHGVKGVAASSQNEFTAAAQVLYPSAEDVTEEQLLKCYGLDKTPKQMPCSKRCFQNPWCLGGMKVGGAGKSGSRTPLSQQPRESLTIPVGLQNTANTCWINSALQLFFHSRKFRNALNSLEDFRGDESLDTLVHLLQVVFAEMETHPFKAIACEPGSVFERLGMFASREVMKKDANNELLKCVSEFMENTIDWLVAESKLASVVAPMFTITLTRLAKWQCSKCSTVHQNQLSPASCYTMGAYISADQAPLQQCLMDLQAETQTGVLMVCGGQSTGGCGATVKVDRVVTPKLDNLPYHLIIRNNSLIAEDVKRRLHVVYPENLNLSEHTLDGRPAHYVLSGVIFHHGHWVKHYSAQVKTEGGRWFSFNDETVLEMNHKPTTANTQSNPQENHRNYFSLGTVSAKYKAKGGERVSRGAFIWLYTLVDMQPADPYVPPHPAVIEYISRQKDRDKNDNSELLKEIQGERQTLLKELTVTELTAPYAFVSEWLLHSWLSSQDCRFVVPSSALQVELRCEHGNLKPLISHIMKCVRKDKVFDLLSARCGIHNTHESTDSSSKTQQQKVCGENSDVKTEINSTDNGALPKNCLENSLRDTSNTSAGIENSNFKNNSHKSNLNTDVTQKDENSNLNASTSSSSWVSDIKNIQKSLENTRITNLKEISSTLTHSSDAGGVSRTVKNLSSPHEVSSALPSDVPVGSKASSEQVSCTEISPASKAASAEELAELLRASRIVCGDEQLCRHCVAKHARHIIFLENMRTLHRLCKKQALKQQQTLYRAIGAQTLELWPKLAVRKYVKDNNIEMSFGSTVDILEQPVEEDEKPGAVGSKTTEASDAEGCGIIDDSTTTDSSNGNTLAEQKSEEVTGFQLFNEDLVCCHHQLNPQAVTVYLPEEAYETLVDLCGEDIHPASVLDDFLSCADCQNVLVASESACERGAEEKKRLPALFADKKRPSHMRDCGSVVYLLDRDFFDDWRTFVRGCVRGAVDKRPELSNEDLFCKHKRLHYNPATLDATRLIQMWVVLWEQEWVTLLELYGQPKGGAIKAVISSDGFTSLQPDLCEEGCVESQAVEDYEDQFEYERELIYVRQVQSPSDIPQRAANTRSMGPVATPPSAASTLPYPALKLDTQQASTKNHTSGLSNNEATSTSVVIISKPQDSINLNFRSNAAAVTESRSDISSTLTPDISNSISADRNSSSSVKSGIDKNCNSPDSSTQTAVNVADSSIKIGDNDDKSSAKNNVNINDVSSSVNGLMSSTTNSDDNDCCVVFNAADPSDRLNNETNEKRSHDEQDDVSAPCKVARLTRGRGRGAAGSRPAQQSRQSNRKRGQQQQQQSRLSNAINARLVRASKAFASTDTVRQVQNFIAERTSVWPMLQTVWLGWSEDLAVVLDLPRDQQFCPVMLKDEHLTMTLGALRVRPGDTVYFKAAKEDMEKAAGDGVMEYDELPI